MCANFNHRKTKKVRAQSFDFWNAYSKPRAFDDNFYYKIVSNKSPLKFINISEHKQSSSCGFYLR